MIKLYNRLKIKDKWFLLSKEGKVEIKDKLHIQCLNTINSLNSKFELNNYLKHENSIRKKAYIEFVMKSNEVFAK